MNSSTSKRPTIVRIWRGRTTRERADEYEAYNYEVGIKLEMFDHRVLFNTALFYSDYKDLQLTVLRVNPLNPLDSGTTTANAGKADIKGLEFELITRPWRELVVRGSLGLTDAEYDEFMDQLVIAGVPTPIDRSNENFTNVPEVSIDGSVEYPLTLTAMGLPDYGTVTPLVHVYHESSTDTHITPGGFASKRFRQDAYTLLDLRTLYLVPVGAQPKTPGADDRKLSPEELAKLILDDTTPKDRREALVKEAIPKAADVVRAMVADLSDKDMADIAAYYSAQAVTTAEKQK